MSQNPSTLLTKLLSISTLLLITIFLEYIITGSQGSYVETLAGSSAGNINGYGTNVKFQTPTDVAISPNGEYAIISDRDNNVLKRLELSTAAVSVLAGSTAGYVNGIGSNAKFNSPSSVVFHPNGTYALVTDQDNNRIRIIDLSTFAVDVVAGKTSLGTTNAIGTNAEFNVPATTSFTPDGNYAYVADHDNNMIRMIVLSTRAVSRVVGRTVTGTTNGIGTNALLNSPIGITVSPDGTFALIADTGNNLIRHLILSTNLVTRLAGIVAGGNSNGIGANAEFNSPSRIGISSNGLFAVLSDRDNDSIRLIILSTASVSTLAGTTSGFVNGLGAVSKFNHPTGSCLSQDGSYVLVADRDNQKIRKISIADPTTYPTSNPSFSPTWSPTTAPTLLPTFPPSSIPTRLPTSPPTELPTSSPTVPPSITPSESPTVVPTSSPSPGPSVSPTIIPSLFPTHLPSLLPTSPPTEPPTESPTDSPTIIPSVPPTISPSSSPSSTPSASITETSIPSVSPTALPSLLPNSDPTSPPTELPTSSPTVVPSILPSESPTVVPTSTPSPDPSLLPTITPSSLPTHLPSLLPTSPPSESPTESPSESPTEPPTITPSVQPTISPSSSPSSTPSASITETSIPSVSPTALPSSIPTRLPTSPPTELPTSSPTVPPSITPSESPTVVPTSSPSPGPSVSPTIIPSLFPTHLPSLLPTSPPSESPTFSPSVSPSATPSVQPTISPSSSPSSSPTIFPTDSPTSPPSISPTDFPTLFPTNFPTNFPTLIPTTRPSDSPTMVPSTFPTFLPSLIPTAFPTPTSTRIPTKLPTSPHPSSFPTNQPTTPPPPAIISGKSLVSERTRVKVQFLLSHVTKLSCLTLLSSSPPPLSVDVITSLGYSQSELSSQSSINFTISNLLPDTSYFMYCVGINSFGYSIPLNEVITNRISFRTQCCKQINVKTTNGLLSPFQQFSNFLQLTMDGPPSTEITISIICYKIEESHNTSADIIFPNQFIFNSRSWSTQMNATLLGSNSGNYQLSLQYSVDSVSDIFEFHYWSPLRFTIQEIPMEPIVPTVNSVAFSNDGTTIVISFSTATDRASQDREFLCSKVLLFVGSDESYCSFHDALTLIINPSGAKRLAIGSLVQIVPHSLRAQCHSLNITWCRSWTSVSSSPIPIQPPSSPIIPVVIIRAPTTSGPCDSPRFDLTTSSGGSGREWSSFIMRVTSTNTDATTITSLQKLNEYFATKSVSHTHSPMVLPQGILAAGSKFLFEVKLCNFLGSCGVATHPLETTNKPLPMLQIGGPQEIVQKTSDSVSLQVRAFESSCNGSTTSVGLNYSWSVYRDGVLQNGLESISKSPSRFRLNPYSLIVGSVYLIKVTVRSVSSNSYNSITFKITVIPSHLVLLLSGPNVMTLNLGSSIIVDASQSYDPDFSHHDDSSTPTSHLNYSWSCYQQSPQLSSRCGLNIALQSHESVAVLTSQPDVQIGSVFVLKVTVFDTTRETSTNIIVSIGSPSDPEIRVSLFEPLLNNKWNPMKDLMISGVVSSSISGYRSQWTIDDNSMKLIGMNGTLLSKYINTGSNQCNLIIKGGSLVGSDVPYVFSLSVLGFSGKSSIVIPTNSPPVPGLFNIDPPNGTAMTTQFQLSASLWLDVDLPLSYEFSYLTPDSQSRSRSMIVQGRSEFSSTTTYLPEGGETNEYFLHCTVRVFDSLGSYSISSLHALVQQASVSLQDLNDFVFRELSLSGDVDITKQIISVGVSMVNKRNCSTTPSCSSLHRLDCLNTDNVCGSCLNGFIGSTAGDGNTPCYDLEAWKSLNHGNQARSCHNNCHNHGKCYFQIIDSGEIVDKCLMSDITCTALCECNEGWQGEFCSLNVNEFSLRQETRSLLLSSLNDVTSVDEPSEDRVLSWISSLSSLTQNRYEISPNSGSFITNIASAILDSSSVSPSNLIDVLGSLDVSLLVTGNQHSSSRRLSSVSVDNDPMIVLEQYGITLMKSLVPGQAGFDNIQNSFRLTTQFLTTRDNEEFLLILPQSEIELMSGSLPTICTFSLNENQTMNELAMTALSTKSFLSESLKNNITTNPLSFYFQSTAISRIRCNIPTIKSESYFDESQDNDLMILNVTCEEGDFSTSYLNCSRKSNRELMIPVSCQGYQETLSVLCPTMSRKPVCSLLSNGNTNSSFNCSIESFTSTSVSCVCQMDEREAIRRRLEGTEDTSIQLYSFVDELVTDFAVTVLTTNDLNSSSLSKSVVVLVMYGLMWGVGLMIIGINLYKKRSDKKLKPQNHEIKVVQESGRTTKVKIASNPENVKLMLMKYMDEVFPAVFQTQSYLSRMLEEVLKHHRYIVLFTRQGEDLNSKKIVTCIHLLTVQSMLMFILAVLYDLQFPNNGATCGTFTTIDSCLEETTPFDQSRTLCTWELIGLNTTSIDDYACRTQNQSISFKTAFFISVTVTFFASIVNFIVDYIFVDILSAPTADSVKVASQDTVISKTIRRVSNVNLVGVKSKKFPPKTHAIPLAKSSSVKEMFLSNNETRIVPLGLATAHFTVSELFHDLVGHTQHKEESDPAPSQSYQNDLRPASAASAPLASSLRSSSSFASPISFPASPPSPLFAALTSDINGLEVNVDDLFERLKGDIREERNLIRRVHEKESFDTLWGIDQNGKFLALPPSRKLFCGSETGDVGDVIKSELKFIQKETQFKVKKLQLATDVHIGMEILHLFILDLLGRDTAAAKIFQIKSEEDFRHSMVVTRLFKTLAWIVVILLNFFFVLFTMLRGLQRGESWQRLFVVACVIQLVVEVFFYETTECILMNFIIPDLVRNEVQSVGFSIRQTIQKLCSGSTSKQTVLDAPSYLFVSTNVAQHFPSTLSSLIVRSYHSSSPGELSHKWKNNSLTGLSIPFLGSHSSRRVRKFAITTLLFSLLQKLGSMSPSLQRVLIHLLQPIVLGGFYYFGILLSGHPLSFIGVGVVSLGLIVYVSYSIHQDRLEKKESLQQIVPQISHDDDSPHPPPLSSSSSSPPPPSPHVPLHQVVQSDPTTPHSPRNQNKKESDEDEDEHEGSKFKNSKDDSVESDNHDHNSDQSQRWSPIHDSSSSHRPSLESESFNCNFHDHLSIKSSSDGEESSDPFHDFLQNLEFPPDSENEENSLEGVHFDLPWIESSGSNDD